LTHDPDDAGLRILATRSALFEAEMDLGRWTDVPSNQIDHFVDRLIESLPTVWEHKCMMGQRGGFVHEMREGTNLAHVVEHVLLELLHLADPERRIYTGWTTPRRGAEGTLDTRVFIIHYQVLSSAQARLAAQCAVGYVSDLLDGRTPDTGEAIRELTESFTWSES